MAIGIALLFGVRLPENFNAPFRATSVLVFWQRWHMTLSRFLRDYVFLPLADMRIAGTAAHDRAIRHGDHGDDVAVRSVAWRRMEFHTVGRGPWRRRLVCALAWRRIGPRLPALAAWALTVAPAFLLSGIPFRPCLWPYAWKRVFAGLAAAPDWPLLGKAWIIAAAIGCATVLPASRMVCEWLVRQANPLVPVVLGWIGIATQCNWGR